MPKSLKKQGGGSMSLEDMIRMSLGKILVYYRVRHGKPVEIFERLDVPTDMKKAVDFIRVTKVKFEQRLDHIQEYIPEYVEVRNKLKNAQVWTSENDLDMKIMNGYELYPALYDPKDKKVLTTHFLVPNELFYELFDKKREKDVIDAVNAWGSSLWF
jgi:hypothetical protein